MSILANDRQTELQQLAINILNEPKSVVNNLFNSWFHAFSLLHSNPDLRPELLQIIGPRAAELFQLNDVLTTFMKTQLSGVRDDIVGNIDYNLKNLPNFIFNQDGSVSEVTVVLPTASTVEFFTPLSAVTLTGGTALIPGTFVFAEPNSTPVSIGTIPADILFIPQDTVNFKTTTHTINLSVVEANLPTATFVIPENLVFDGTPKVFDAVVIGPTAIYGTYTGRNGTSYDESITPPSNVGDYTYTVYSGDTNFTGSQSYDYSITAA